MMLEGQLLSLRGLVTALQVPGLLQLPRERLRVPPFFGLPYSDIPLTPLLMRLDGMLSLRDCEELRFPFMRCHILPSRMRMQLLLSWHSTWPCFVSVELFSSLKALGR